MDELLKNVHAAQRMHRDRPLTGGGVGVGSALTLLAAAGVASGAAMLTIGTPHGRGSNAHVYAGARDVRPPRPGRVGTLAWGLVTAGGLVWMTKPTDPDIVAMVDGVRAAYASVRSKADERDKGLFFDVTIKSMTSDDLDRGPPGNDTVQITVPTADGRFLIGRVKVCGVTPTRAADIKRDVDWNEFLFRQR